MRDHRAPGTARAWLLCMGILFCWAKAAFGAEPDDWPLWRYDAARSGRSPVVLPADLHLHWVRELPAPRRAWAPQLDDRDKLEFDRSYSPVVMGDRIFVGSMTTDRLTAYRIEDGEELWRVYADGPIRLAPAAWDGRVFFGSDDGTVTCVSAETGNVLWRFRASIAGHRVLGNERVISLWAVRGGPVVLDGIVYVAAGVWPSHGTFVYALDARTGALVWENTGEGTAWQRQPHGGAFSFAGIAPQGYLAAQGDRLVVSGGRSTPGLFDRNTGELLHLDIFGKDVGGYRVRIEGDFFFNHGRRHSLEDGSLSGSDPAAEDPLAERAAALGEYLDAPVFETLAARGRLFVVTDRGTLYAFGGEPRPPVRHGRAVPAGAVSAPADRQAEALLARAPQAHAGYALFLGVGNGDLVEAFARRTDLHIVCIEPDEARIDALRRRFDDAGLYGTRVALLPGDPATEDYPPFISSLIVMQDSSVLGRAPDAGFLDRVYRWLRPYDGVALLSTSAASPAAEPKVFYRAAMAGFDPVNGAVNAREGWLEVARTGPLPGAGQWTHQYADAANTAVSRDKRVRLPLGVLWYGGPSHDTVLPRHAAGPRPQVAGGRLVILGVEAVNARDVFTGRELWVRSFPGIGHYFTNLELEEQWREGRSVYMTNQPGAAYIGSPYVTLPDAVYVRYRGQVHRLDPATGETLALAPIPGADPEGALDWGHISAWEDLLIVTGGTHVFDDERPGLQNWNASSSEQLTAMDRFTGRVLWTRRARTGFRHNAIATAGGRIFLTDGLSPEAVAFAQRRGLPGDAPLLMALDARTGDVHWETESGVFGTFISYSEEHDLLIEGGSQDARRHLSDEPRGRMTARRGADGAIVWEQRGRFDGPVILRGSEIFPARPGTARSILTGDEAMREHPLTGESAAWSYWKAYGCSTSNASEHLLLFRSGAAGYSDLERGGGTGSLGGFKSGCTASMQAADGVLSAPDYTRTCTCSYQNQTSLAFVHMPEMEFWTADQTVGRGEGPLRRVGLNLGAPGNRRSEDGTLFVHWPNSGAPAPALPVAVRRVGDAAPEVELVSVTASGSALERPESTLDGRFSTGWSVRSDAQGRFRQWLEYALSAPAAVDRMKVAWSAPAPTRFSIRASGDGETWTTVFEGRHQGDERAFQTYEFDPVEARVFRFEILEQERERRDMVSIWQVRLGALPFPSAYARFAPQDIFRGPALRVDTAGGLNWVAASGLRGLAGLELGDVRGGGAPYRVTLHFAEPDQAAPGERVFDIVVQGQTIEAGFDIAAAANGANRAVVRRFPGIHVDDTLRVELRPAAGSRFPPVLSGVELVRE